MASQLRRRAFLQRAGTLGGLLIAGSAIPEILVACGGNVQTPVSSSATTIASEGLKQPGVLQWGAAATGGAPYVFHDPTNPTQLIGFEVDIADALAKLMGIKAKMVEVEYPQLEQALQSGRFDLIMNGWEINEDRKKTEVFSQPYYRYGQQIIVRSDDKRFADKTENDNLSLKDLEGLTVGTGAGFKAADILATNPKIKVKTYDPDLPLNDLALGRLDAVFLDYPMATYYVLGGGPTSQKNPKLKPIGKPFESSDYVIAFLKGDANALKLKGEIDQAISQLKKDGTLRKIYERWKMWNDQQAEIGIQ
ncbi:polar amino acid transport system substrate-binding protein [Thermosporothrix hazakensis]|jgi:polar amino acid transport system substrate-binding protein|uniref:Polar amino acid transport system substrate-binding protein n=2 Tax=Thermosporothrix TaxID=768650 RepID=A0A326TYN5_THEHA|nr:ABC transporter substrate-binding protein [Thermosporothrix hazakensis]PZW22475.1 polar amino acid transport system substrate-binding protein [Thermosporothrix hazakensis]BBH86043.1 amino acid ABC transporter substrate-binding protein [Thermosporothrix sp. COM3]GCE45532.1 amino acid ABC transporter substrate-binding protein [Thermosporothrix hazakensis]